MRNGERTGWCRGVGPSCPVTQGVEAWHVPLAAGASSCALVSAGWKHQGLHFRLDIVLTCWRTGKTMNRVTTCLRLLQSGGPELCTCRRAATWGRRRLHGSPNKRSHVATTYTYRARRAPNTPSTCPNTGTRSPVANADQPTRRNPQPKPTACTHARILTRHIPYAPLALYCTQTHAGWSAPVTE